MTTAARMPPEKARAAVLRLRSAVVWSATPVRSCSRRGSSAAPFGSGSASASTATGAVDGASADGAASDGAAVTTPHSARNFRLRLSA